MGMVIHDDFWEAAQAMPEKQRAPFIYAVVRYRFTGEGPEGSPPWLPVFIAIRGRLDLADEASERGRRAAEARWGKRGDAGAPDEPDADAHADAYASAHAGAHADAHAGASNDPDTEVEDEVEDEDRPHIPYGEIVRNLNAACGTAYRPTSRRTRALIRARWAEGYRLPDFEAVVAAMSAAWLGDPKMSAYLRPETLFGPKFEGYRELARQAAAKRAPARRTFDPDEQRRKDEAAIAAARAALGMGGGGEG